MRFWGGVEFDNDMGYDIPPQISDEKDTLKLFITFDITPLEGFRAVVGS